MDSLSDSEKSTSRRQRVFGLREQAPAILPSLLLCDFGNLEREIAELEQAGVPGLHLDVMDGRFVPNLTYGMPIVEACRSRTELPLDVHLMIEAPERYLKPFVEAGADHVTVHIEACADPQAVLGQIHELGASAGLAINPGTAFDRIEPHVDACDLILVMSVEAGFGGQSFNPAALERLETLRSNKPSLVLEVDGGVNDDTIGRCAGAGAELFVVGSAIFRSDSYTDVVRQLRERAS